MVGRSQKCDGVSAEAEVRMVPQSTAAIDGCSLKGGQTHTQRTHRIEGKIDCHCITPTLETVDLFSHTQEHRGNNRKEKEQQQQNHTTNTQLWCNLLINKHINVLYFYRNTNTYHSNRVVW